MTEDDVASFKWEDRADTEENFVDEDDVDDICVQYEDQNQKEDFFRSCRFPGMYLDY